jgi:hypothetical protein
MPCLHTHWLSNVHCFDGWPQWQPNVEATPQQELTERVERKKFMEKLGQTTLQSEVTENGLRIQRLQGMLSEVVKMLASLQQQGCPRQACDVVAGSTNQTCAWKPE